MSDYWKKKMEELEKETKKSPSQSYWDRKKVELEEEDDIAPIKSVAKTKEKEDDDGLDFFQKSSLFDDGWDFGDVTKTILGSVGDAGLNVVKGAGSLVEGITDLGSYGVAGVADAIGKDDFAEDLRKKTQESYVDKLLKPAEDYLDKSSVFGRTSDAILQGVGQAGGIMATAGIGGALGLGTAGTGALTAGVIGTSSMGSGIGEAYKGGANDLQALKHGLNSGSIDAITELIFGGMGKAINALGFSRGLSSADDILAKLVGSKFKNQIAKNIVEFGIKSGAEGLEEVIAGVAQAYSKYNTYMEDQGIEFSDILKDENLLEQFIVGSFTSGIVQGSGLHIANKTGTDFITGYNQNEQSVIKKEVENRIAEQEKDGRKLTAQEKSKIEAQVEKDLDKGYISTDLIEEVVGGDTYKAYRDSVEREDALFKEYEELGKATNPTLAQQYRYRELDSRVKSIKDNDIRSRRKEHLDQFVSEQVNGTRLAESYNERTRKGQAFEADLTKYDKKQQVVIQKAVESGILNNTNRTHEFVDMIAKISADKGVLFDFTNNQKLKDSGFAMDGVVRNGFKTKDGITINVQAAKSMNFVVGHEITHVLEGTDLYKELQKTVFEYAKSKGEYESRLEPITALYKKYAPDADPLQELTADLVGDYLFTDQDFINNLSVNNRNVFQKIYDEVKYLLKVATAGSKEARQLEKVKRTFEKAYREAGKAHSETKYSISETTDGRSVAVVDNDILRGIDTGKWDSETKKAVKKAAREELKKFSDGFVINGIEYVGNKTSRAEYTRSDYSEALARKNPSAYLDKMRAASVLDDVVRVATDWKNDGELKYERDDYVDFVRGKTLIMSGDRGYRAIVLAGITEDGKVIFHDVEDVYPDSFEIKNAEPSTTVSADKSPNSILEGSAAPNVAQEGENVKFSLSEAVEETKDLVALHNLTADKLAKSLELGGLPMPSLAITKADIPHSNFGEITLIFDRKTIDPKSNKKNKVYSADAWTPVFPRTEYEADSKVGNRISQKLRELGIKVDEYFQRDLSRVSYGFEDYLNREGGEEGLIQRVMDNYGLKAAYLEEHGKHIAKVTKQEEAKKDYNPNNADRYQKVMDILGVTTADEISKVNLKDARDDHGAELEAVWPGITANALRMGRLFGIVKSYLEDTNSGPVYNTVTDAAATQKLVDEALDSEGYEAWVRNLFTGIVKDSGIYNNKELFTPSGNRRSFKQTHLPVTLENIVKAMASQNDGKSKNVSGFNGIKTLRASTAETFKSVAEMHQRKGRLQHLTQEEADALNDSLQNRLFEIMQTIDNEGMQSSERNPYIRLDSIGETLAEIGETGKYNVADIQKSFRQYGKEISDDTALAVKQLLYDVTQMPVNIFEAKPQRVVSFDEAKVFVIPNNVDGKLKQELLNRGYSIAEYDPKVEGDRQRVVNQFEEFKFSLSDVGTGPKTYGSYNVYGKDIALEAAPVTEEIAPVAENATTEASNATPNATNATPVLSNATPVLASEEMFPDDLAPVQQELENLMAEQDELRQALETAVSVGDYEQISGLTADYESVTARIRELQAQEDERFNTLGDSDMPPEVEAPYPGEPSDVPDPFAERDMVEVGKRSVKAYQYENPEVKPFFQEAAYGMLGDLRSGTKGEKIFNGDLYYQSGGEEGWMGTKRNTTSDIADLLDTWHYTYDEIEKGLNAIIEDDGKENNAVSKRIEFMLDDRLRNGYTGVWGEPIPANQEYINLLKEKQVTEYSQEAFDKFMATADQYAPPVEEDIAPVRQKPRSGYAPSEQMKLPLYHDPNNVSPAMDEVRADGDIAPVFETESGQQAIFPDADVPKAVTRKELHTSIIDNIKTKFAEKGFDFDAVLKKAKNLSTFSTVDNIPQRVMEKALGYKEGGILSDITVNKVAQNETQGIKWLNSFTDRKNGLLAQISKQYNIKPGSKESAAAQMYAEGFYVVDTDKEGNYIKGKSHIVPYGDAELAADFPDVVKQAQIKGLARDKRIRKIYDDTLKAINESRTRNAYPEIPRLDNYFLHFRAMEDTFSRLGLPFNPNDIKAKDLPTDLNGVTADLKPGQPFFASAMHREGKQTSFDLLSGLERYLTSAKNQIYHIDDIQNLRALRNYLADTYGQAKGLENLDLMTEEEAQERIKDVYSSHLSTFAKFLNEEANVLAGKTALIDRGVEGVIGRRGMTFLDTLNRQVGANMVGYNISSSLTNFLAPVQAFAKSNKAAFLKGFAQTVSNRINSLNGNDDGFAENSPVMIRRKGAERFHRTLWQKMSDPGYALMSAVDDISTELIARAKYNELTAKGMESQQAHIETDKWVSRLMGDRSIGQQPQLYNSKMLGIFTKFQLEVRNQLDSQFYDTIQEAKVSNEYIANRLERNAKTAAKVTSTFVQLAIGQHLFGKVFESVAGYNPAFDIISAIVKAFGWDDDEEDEDTVLDNLEQGFLELMEDMPYYSIFSGGRIPIESALPVNEMFTGEDQYGNKVHENPVAARFITASKAAPYYFMPGGYGQIKKTVAGLNMFSDEHPVAGSYTDSGNLRFPVEDTLANRAQAAVFGQYASQNARDYFDNERSALKEKQIQEFADVGLSIQDYWKYRDGLKDLSKLEEKINYINRLNLTTAQKNVLVNNLTDRKEAIDMADYDQYGSLDEFDYATKNPEKYALLDEMGITYNTYKNAGDDARKAYDWALENPDKYPMSKAIAGDVVEYRRYTSDLNDLKADKDSSGKSISGSRKDKVIDYINSLDIDYGAKLILFKSEYKSDNESNYQIVEYLNSRNDISYEEMVAILSDLDFTVTEDGTVYWD